MPKPSMTLIELIVVIVIISVLSAITVNSFTQVDARRFKNDIQLIMSDLSLARELAVTRHQAYTVNFNITNDMYTVCNANCACCNANGCLSACNCCVLGGAGSGRNLRPSMNQAPAYVKFSPPLGTITLSSNTSIGLSRDDITKRPNTPSANVIINANTGYVYVQ